MDKYYNLSITLLEDLHTGTGTGNMIIDDTQALDETGKPVIDRHHFRGVLRDNALRLVKLGIADKGQVDELFGKSGGRQRKLDCSSLRTVSEDCLTYWETSARQQGSRLPEDHSLRRIEYIKAGTEFTGKITLKDVDDELDLIFQKILNFTCRLGSERTRGSGQIKIKWTEKNCTAKKSLAPLMPGATKIRLLLINEEPLCIPISGHAGNIICSESHIPGRTLFAALCAKAATVNDEALKSLFTDQLSIGNAYPIPEKIAGQNVRKLFCMPMPNNIYTIKPASSDVGLQNHWPHWAVAEPTIENIAPLRAGRDVDKFNYAGQDTAKRPKGDLYLVRDENGDWHRYRQQLTIRMRNKRGDPCEKLKRDDTELFSEQRIPAHTHFLLDIECLNSDLMSRIHGWMATQTLYIGRGKSPIGIQSLTSAIHLLEQNECQTDLTVTASSDWIVRSDNLGYLTELGKSAFLTLFGIADPAKYADLQFQSIQETETQGSFNYASGLPKRPFHVIRRGSVYRFKGGETLINELFQELLQGKRYVGERHTEGYGQYHINLPLPDFLSKTDSAPNGSSSSNSVESKTPPPADQAGSSLPKGKSKPEAVPGKPENQPVQEVRYDEALTHELEGIVAEYIKQCLEHSSTSPPPQENLQSLKEIFSPDLKLPKANINRIMPKITPLVGKADFALFYSDQEIQLKLPKKLQQVAEIESEQNLSIAHIHCFLDLLIKKLYLEQKIMSDVKAMSTPFDAHSSDYYKLIIKGVLVQQTAFSTGGNAPDNNIVDMPLARDGRGRFTLRGTGLAGALIATARQLYDLSGQKNITEGTPQHQHQTEQNPLRLHESVWIFHHAHPKNLPEDAVEIRDNVAIRQKTGAAKHGAKFDTEILPAGTQWDFLLEIDEYRDESKTAASIALNALQQWQAGCWLGRDVARGLGWMKLEQMQVYRLDRQQALIWPDAREEPWETIKKLTAYQQCETAIQAIKKRNPPTKQPEMLTGSITISVGEKNDEAYGLDFLSVGGNNNQQLERPRGIPKNFIGKQFEDKRYLKPLGQEPDSYFAFEREGEAKSPDFSLAVTKLQGNIVPHIPGSSIRGTLRHGLSWLLRHEGVSVWEPGGENNYPEQDDIVLQLFGSTQRSAALLISDALLVNGQPDNWQAAILEMHAEDEFTQGVYGSSKFNHTCLVKGQFKASYHLTLDNKIDKNQAQAALQKLRQLADNRMLPLGSGQWKGLGWVKWEIIPDESVTE